MLTLKSMPLAMKPYEKSSQWINWIQLFYPLDAGSWRFACSRPTRPIIRHRTRYVKVLVMDINIHKAFQCLFVRILYLLFSKKNQVCLCFSVEFSFLCPILKCPGTRCIQLKFRRKNSGFYRLGRIIPSTMYRQGKCKNIKHKSHLMTWQSSQQNMTR